VSTNPRPEPGGRSATIDVVVAGAATRDVADDDPRGWRLGGAASFAALTIARLGLRVVAILGVDADAAAAEELSLLRDAGVDLRLVPLARGPVFENVERPDGRAQRVRVRPNPMPVPTGGVLAVLGRARGWFLAPVADELTDDWLRIVPPEAPVGLGWQGLLRAIGTDGVVERRTPGPSAFLSRATLVAVSQDDLAPTTELRQLAALLDPSATLVITRGAEGGLLLDGVDATGRRRLRRYDAIPAAGVVDPTGAGDTFAAALFAARVEPRLVGGRLATGYDLLLASAAASLAVERPGLAAVPTRAAIRARLRGGIARASRSGRG
jgi:sugar/nucleoside kinase (ribokinase family)